jgi:hypothetical protein
MMHIPLSRPSENLTSLHRFETPRASGSVAKARHYRETVPRKLVDSANIY